MMFFKLWKHDLDYGLLRKMVFYVLLGFGQAFLFCRGFSSWAAAMSSIPDVGELTETFGNHLLYLFQGIDEYIPSPDEPFDFPSMWLLVFLCGNLLTLTYPLRDLEGIGQQILVRSGRREYWWLAKCGWEIVSSFVYLLMLALGVLSYCLVFRIPIKAEISQRLVEVMIGWGLDRSLPQAEVWLWLLVIPLLLLIFLNLLQLLVGLVFGPIWGFAVNGALLLLSAYWMKSFLPGNYAMFRRSIWVLIDRGMVMGNGAALLIGGSLCVIIVGGIVFHRRDILKKE